MSAKRHVVSLVLGAVICIVVLVAAAATAIYFSVHRNTTSTAQQVALPQGQKVEQPLDTHLIGGNLGVSGLANVSQLKVAGQTTLGGVSVQGQLNTNNLVLTPSNSSSHSAGQLYVATDGSLNYYTSSGAVNLSQAAATISTLKQPQAGVLSLQGQSGNVVFTGGNGVAINGTSIVNTGVTSFGGATGALNVGSGLTLSGNTLSATKGGLQTITSASADLQVVTDANGNVTIASTAAGGSNGVVLAPITAQVDSSSQASININKTGTGNLLQFTTGVSPVNRFVVDDTGAITSGSISFGQVTGVPTLVNSVGGSTGAILLGGGLQMSGQSIINTGVRTVGGMGGDITLGTGLGTSGSQLVNTGVTSLGGTSGTITIGSGLTISGGQLAAVASGIQTISGTTNQISVSGTNNVTLSLPQDIAVGSSPKFAALTLSSALPIASGGTGATTAAGARSSLGAAASGANTDITSLGAVTSISSGTSALALQGGAGTTLSVTSGGYTTTFGVANPTANVTYTLQSAVAGNYDICTTAGNCVGEGGGVTSPGGTAGQLAVFTGSNSLGSSIISANSSTATVAGTLSVNTISPTAAMTVGSTAEGLTLQGSTLALTSTSGSYTNTLSFATPTGSSKAITIPDAAGTVAVSASGPLQIDAHGNISCPSCLTSGGSSGGTSGVTSVNGISGAVLLSTVTASSLQTAGSTITIQDASATVKGLASFDGTNLVVTSGAVNTAQNITTTSSPTFAAITITNAATAGSVVTPSLDTGTATPLNIGATKASAINIGNTSSNIATTIQGTVLIKPSAVNLDSTTLFQIQNSYSSPFFTADSVHASVIVTGQNMYGANLVIQAAQNGSTMQPASQQLVFETSGGTTTGSLGFDGNNNLALGASALGTGVTTGNYNLAIGYAAAGSITTGANNVIVGKIAGSKITTGGSNVAIGQGAAGSVTTGSSNTAVGDTSLSQLQGAATSNTAIGSNALNGSTSGNNNTGIGYYAGYGNVSGSNNTYVGYSSGNCYWTKNFCTGAALQNSGTFGQYAQVQASNSIVLGATADIQQTNIGIGTTVPLNTFSVSPLNYNTGTASQAGNTVTGSGTSWTSAMVGSEFVFDDGDSGVITAVASATSLTLSTTQTEASQVYRIHYAGLNVTSAGNIGIGTTNPGSNNLMVSGTSLFQSGSATAFQIQNSSGTALLVADASNMTVTVTNLVTGNITVNGHIITGGSTPTLAAGTSACTSPTVSIIGNDTSGTVTVTSGSTGCGVSGTLATVTFNTPFGAAPRVMLTPKSAPAAGLGVYVGTTTKTSFIINVATAPAASTTYTFNYFAVQ